MFDLKFDPHNELGISETVRLVIYDDDSKLFIVKKEIPSFEKIIVSIEGRYNKSSLKYKYQIKNTEKKWSDSHYGYQSFYKIKTKDLLELLDFENKKNLDYQLLMDASKRDVEYCFRHILIKTYSFLLSNPNKSKVQVLQSYLKKLPLEFLEKHSVASHYYSLVYTLTLYIQEANFLTPNQISKEKSYSIISKINQTYSSEIGESIGFRTGWLLAKANIISVYDRTEAYGIYQEILLIGKGFIDNYLTIEALTTYYEQISQENRTYSISGFENYNNLENYKINICFSADPSYFKMFAVGWAQSSLYFPELSFNFGIVTETEKEFEILVNYYQDILRSISNFIGIEIPSNTRFFLIKSSVINKTVYACARFYLSEYILENYEGDTFITDIDQLVIGDLEAYLNSISENELHIYQPKMRSYYCILPGRSHLAGNIYIKNSLEGKEYNRVLVDYVGMGFEEEFSWMLDQNATRYASEKFEVGNLNDLGERVLRQFPNLKRTLRNQL